MITSEHLQEPPDFSLVLGGPIYQMFRRAHLTGPALEHLRLRVVIITAITWVPLFLLSAVGGHLLSGPGLPFLRDIETQVRFLIGVPVLILAELLVHHRIRPVVQTFVGREIIRPEDTPAFNSAIEAAMRLRNSILTEIALLVFTFTVGRWLWQEEVALGSPSWYAIPNGTGLHLTLPGHWFAFVSVPLAQFILLRWYLRLFIWIRFLWSVSRLNLRLQPLHPDGTGGLGFLGKSTYAFGPILFAQGALLSGIIASRILYGGQTLLSFRVSILALVGFFVLVILGPLTVFTPAMARAKRTGLSQYGTLAASYVADFDEKWLQGKRNDEAILGTADIQSLADMANSFAVVRGMRAMPFGLDDVKTLVVATAAPLLPLLLTVMPLEELLDRLVKLIF